MTTIPTPCRRASLVLTAVLAIIFVTAHAAPLQAQVVSDPRLAEFDPSPDHWQTLDSGQPAVVRYELGVYMCGAAAPFTTIDMGKPSPEADGKIRFDFSSSVTGWPLPGGNYEARVSAVGPEGSAPSAPSNPFTFTAGSSCTYGLSAASFQVPSAGGTYSVDVTTGASCQWFVTTPASWVTLWTSGATGSGTVPFGVQANSLTSARIATVTVGGQTLTISQAAAAPAAKTTPTITWQAPSAITQGTALGSAQLNATASVPGTFAYNPAAGTVLAAGTYTLTTAFTPADATLYNPATASATLTVKAAAYTLSITRPAGGTVTGAGINCGTGGNACSVTMPGPMTIGLQATSDTGYAFSVWTGGCAGTSQSLWVPLNGPVACGATFTAVSGSTSGGTTSGSGGGPSVPPPNDSVLPLGAPYTLTITQPTGGTVKSAGINCGTKSKSCSVTMPGPMTLGLQAVPDSGYTFLSWSGHCSGTSASYALALEGARTCGAKFIPSGSTVIQPPPDSTSSGSTGGGTTSTGGSLPMGAPYTLTVTRPIGGTVNAAGIDCGTRGKLCSVTMPAALWLGLQATPDRGYVFTGWTGHCSGTQPSYSLALEGPRTCGAVFTAK